MSIEIKKITTEQLEVNGKLIEIECGAIVDAELYNLSPEEITATYEFIERTKRHHLKSSIVNK